MAQIRPKLLEDPSLPMLHLSVRITHADDLFQTCREYYVARGQPKGGQPIEGLQLKCYRECEGGARALASRLPTGLTALELDFTGCGIEDSGARFVVQQLPAGLEGRWLLVPFL